MKLSVRSFLLLLLPCLSAPAAEAVAQDARAYVPHLNAGQEAWREGDVEAYLREMEQAERLIPDGQLNRPFVQYHHARALALSNRPEEAVSVLERAWEEGIEGLMIFFAEYDPDFQSVRAHPAYERITRLPASLELEVERLAEGLVLLRGAGSNLIAFAGADGVLLVDTGYRQAVPAIERAIRSLESGQLRYIVGTHAHEDHVGGNTGLGASATILAHPATAEAMLDTGTFIEGVDLPERTEDALPDILVEGSFSMSFNGQQVSLQSFPAHTDGDLVVSFPDSRVLHMGDLYQEGNPFFAPATENPVSYLEDVRSYLTALAPATRVVGGHDGPVPLGTALAQVDKTLAALRYVQEGLDAGRTAEEINAGIGERPWPERWIGYFVRLLGGEG